MDALNDEEKARLCQLMEIIGENMLGFGNYTGCDIDVVTPLGDKALHSAVVMGNSEAVRLLIKAGADVNAKGEDGYTPLHEAVIRDDIDILKMLLDSGAKLEEKTDGGEDAWVLGKRNSNLRISRFLQKWQKI